MHYVLILFQVILNTVSQVLLKTGVNKICFNQKIMQIIFSFVTNFYIILGVTGFVISLFLWLYLLSKFELSFIYPFGSLSYALAIVAGCFWLNEPFSFLRMVGVFIIVIGVYCVAKS